MQPRRFSRSTHAVQCSFDDWWTKTLNSTPRRAGLFRQCIRGGGGRPLMRLSHLAQWMLRYHAASITATGVIIREVAVILWYGAEILSYTAVFVGERGFRQREMILDGEFVGSYWLWIIESFLLFLNNV